ncbi:cyclohexadienyl dehydratase [Bacillus sp. OxB-1]|uniref:transporter substrate-binding domain-containing protein n=1 Tax=Bacillus sp. (strain OxB-1) TaxID=98228 RepID=UPI000581E304|nr:transporter substrate-binding domain-containing protein [Bacillus sp. OxB-1]BAQ11139.1 cyclohexadienyl dehydratase [Bacillus sp. OxB-1]
MKNSLKAVLAVVLAISGFLTYSLFTSAASEKDKTDASLSESRLDRIIDQGVIRVGTPGDYQPFTYLNPETKQYEGYDIEAAKSLAKELGVEVEFVETTWPTLMEDLLADKFDIAMGGITRNMGRQIQAQFSHGYIPFGKSPLIRAEDKEKFTSLEAINQPDVTIGVNPGGTNQKFVNAHMTNANVIVVQNNLDIPGKVASGEVDVMITDSIEAIHYARENDVLYAALTEDPWEPSQFGYLMQQGDQKFLNTVNFWMEEMELKGVFEELRKDFGINPDSEETAE